MTKINLFHIFPKRCELVDPQSRDLTIFILTFFSHLEIYSKRIIPNIEKAYDKEVNKLLETNFCFLSIIAYT